MNRPQPSLSQHLLTRSDLAQLEIPAGRILHWLSKGWLEQVAEIPGVPGGPNPVFAVLDGQLRDELASQLVEIGKAEVVFSPLRVRSVLLRTLVQANEAKPVSRGEAFVRGDEPSDAVLLEQLADPLLARTLELAAVGLAEEAQRAVALARAEAHLEILEKAVAVAVARSFRNPQGIVLVNENAHLGIDSPGSLEADDQELEIMETADDEGQFFDAGDLMAEFAEEIEVPADAAPLVTQDQEAPQPLVAETLPDPVEERLANAMTTEVPDAAPEGVEEPTAAANVPIEDGAIAETAAEPCAQHPEEAGKAKNAAGSDVEQVLDFLAAGMKASSEEFASSVDQEHVFRETESGSEEPIVAEPAPPIPEFLESIEVHSDDDRQAVAAVEGIATATLAKVEDFLEELCNSLVQIADRPQAAPVDVQPIAVAVAESARVSQTAAADGLVCLRELSERIAGLGERLEHGLALAVHAALARQPGQLSTTPAAPMTPVPVVIKSWDPTVTVVTAVAFLLACWSAVLWWKTGNTRLAIAILVGANAVACCLLLGRRRH